MNPSNPPPDDKASDPNTNPGAEYRVEHGVRYDDQPAPDLKDPVARPPETGKAPAPLPVPAPVAEPKLTPLQQEQMDRALAAGSAAIYAKSKPPSIAMVGKVFMVILGLIILIPFAIVALLFVICAATGSYQGGIR